MSGHRPRTVLAHIVGVPARHIIAGNNRGRANLQQLTDGYGIESGAIQLEAVYVGGSIAYYGYRKTIEPKPRGKNVTADMIDVVQHSLRLLGLAGPVEVHRLEIDAPPPVMETHPEDSHSHRTRTPR